MPRLLRPPPRRRPHNRAAKTRLLQVVSGVNSPVIANAGNVAANERSAAASAQTLTGVAKVQKAVVNTERADITGTIITTIIITMITIGTDCGS